MTLSVTRSTPAEYDAILALMRLVCDEVHVLSMEIADLGDFLSGGPGVPGYVEQLQSFDAMSQRSFAHAQLLRGLAGILQGSEAEWRTRIDALIAAVPFHADRQRLQSVFRPADRDGETADDGLEWF